jgi:hypothetical protein
MSLENSNDIIGSQTGDLPVCSAVPLRLCHRAPRRVICRNKNCKSRKPKCYKQLARKGRRDTFMSVWILGKAFELMRPSARGTPVGRSTTFGKAVQPNYSGIIHTQYETPIFVWCQSRSIYKTPHSHKIQTRYSFPSITKPTRQSLLNHFLQQTN